MKEKDLVFRNYIDWGCFGIDWQESWFVPATLLSYLYSHRSLTDGDRLIILRVHHLLQTQGVTGLSECLELMKKLSAGCFPPPDTENLRLLEPVYQQILAKTGGNFSYESFIEGDVRGYAFPANFLDLLKSLVVYDLQGKPVKLTAKIAISVLFQLVSRSPILKQGCYFCDGLDLSTSHTHLLYAIAKTIYQKTDWLGDIRMDETKLGQLSLGSKALSVLLQQEVKQTDERRNILDQMTFDLHRHNYGHNVAEQLSPKVYQTWQDYWLAISREQGIDIEEMPSLLASLMLRRKFVPPPTMKPKPNNPVETSLGLLLLAEKNRQQPSPNATVVVLDTLFTS